jgi:hypothetical protein
MNPTNKHKRHLDVNYKYLYRYLYHHKQETKLAQLVHIRMDKCNYR